MPERFLLANQPVQLISENTVNLENLEIYGIVLPVEQQIKRFLELPGVLDELLEHKDKILEQKVANCYGHLLHGEKWLEISAKYEGTILIPITLYIDDFQVDDSTGAHAGKHALAAFYYQISCLPLHLMSRIDFIFVAILAKAVDIKKHSPDAALYAIVNIFTKLEIDGLLIENGDGKSQRIHFILCNIVGDNLGIHVICGLILSFGRSTYFCRFCNSNRNETEAMHELSEDVVMKTVDMYNDIVNSRAAKGFGIMKNSALNLLPSVHVMTNYTSDVMHDELLGTFKYELKHIFHTYVFTLKTTTLSALNKKIEDHGKVEGMFLSTILPRHLKTGSLKMNAREVWFLVQHLALLLPSPNSENERLHYEFALQMPDLWEKLIQTSLMLLA